MASIPLSTICEIANAAAFESRRPWRVKELRAEAFEAWRTVPRRDVSMGLSRVQAFARQRGHAYERVLKAGRDMDALPPDERKPTPERIDSALEAFTIEQWIGLIDGLDQTGTGALLSHIRQHASELRQRFGKRKLERIEGRAVMRDTDLWLNVNRSTLVPISDVYWANVLPELAREANRQRNGHPAKGRSVVEELSSYRGLARHLSKRDERTGREMKVSSYKVKRWRERMEALPFEQFAADKTDDEVKSGAARIAYWSMIRK